MTGRPRRTLVSEKSFAVDPGPRRSPRISAKETSDRLASMSAKKSPKKKVPTPPRVKKDANLILGLDDSILLHSKADLTMSSDVGMPGGGNRPLGDNFRAFFLPTKSVAVDKDSNQESTDYGDRWSAKDLFAMFVVCPTIVILLATFGYSMFTGGTVLPSPNLNTMFGKFDWPELSLQPAQRPNVPSNELEVDVDVLLDKILANDKFHELISANAGQGDVISNDIKLQINDLKRAHAAARDEMAEKLSKVGERVDELNTDEEAVKSEVGRLMAEIDDLLKKQQELSDVVRKGCKEEVVVEAPVSREELSMRIRQELSQVSSQNAPKLSKADVVEVVHEALNVYDADKTGLFDFALESAGGTIATTRCTESYDVTQAVYHVMGVPVWWSRRNAGTILQPGTNPGECWAFKGDRGSVVIRLSRPIRISAVTLEHIPATLSPDGNVSSAPKEFQVLALDVVDDSNPVTLGNFTYNRDNPVETFSVSNKLDRSYPLVELKVLSNHGHPDYTCIYRFRVHGQTMP